MDRPKPQTEEQIELALAEQLQEALRPRECPLNCTNHRAAARSRMCGTIGGDFHDFLRLNEDQIAVIVGDVVGHGVHSALVMAHISGFLRTGDARRSRPAEMVVALNRMLIDLGNRTGTVTSCSMIYAVVDAPTGMAILINAGHPQPVLCRAGEGTVSRLTSHNLLLGVEEFEPEEICLTFEPGHRLVLYTDGITDAANTAGKHFGEARLQRLIRELLPTTPEQCADTVFDAVARHRNGRRQADDETSVVIDRV
jgi:sigma-B regulation protein RsbU (phosphoserine phosphatase)